MGSEDLTGEDEEAANIFVTNFDAVVSEGEVVSESLLVSTLEAISRLNSVDPVIGILFEWAVKEFPICRDSSGGSGNCWESLRFTALLFAGIFKMSGLGLRRELLLLLRLESLPWQVRLLVGTHLLDGDVFDECEVSVVGDPLLTLVGRYRRRNKNSGGGEHVGVIRDKYGLELSSRLMLKSESEIEMYRKEKSEVVERVEEFCRRYPWWGDEDALRK